MAGQGGRHRHLRHRLAEIETDKATMEFEAIDEGIVAKILVAEGHGRGEGRHRDRDPGRRGRGCDALAGSAHEVAAPQDNGAAISASPAEEAQAQQATVQVHAKPGQEPASLRVEPDVPAGTEMVRTTVREALRDAMAEEMRRDEPRFRDGRGSRRISRRVQGHAGAAGRVWRQARSSIRRSPNMASPASAPAPRWAAFAR
jgi:pyruvate/2-oxoglutarate dehydrogenase complex dihydrolipoamide acyltransferase (E2) component